jgi:lipopolysaccharide transport system permease protein
VNSIIGASSMVTRLFFPRGVLPLSTIGLSMVDLGVAAGTFLVYAYATGYPLSITAAWFPLLLLIEIVLTTGVVLLVSGLNTFVRDLRFVVPFLAQIWLLVTPVMYPLSSVPDRLRPIYLLNPMTGLVESFRMTLINAQSPDPSLLVPSIIGAVVLFILGVWYFAATESRFADVI